MQGKWVETLLILFLRKKMGTKIVGVFHPRVNRWVCCPLIRIQPITRMKQPGMRKWPYVTCLWYVLPKGTWGTAWKKAFVIFLGKMCSFPTIYTSFFVWRARWVVLPTSWAKGHPINGTMKLLMVRKSSKLTSWYRNFVPLIYRVSKTSQVVVSDFWTINRIMPLLVSNLTSKVGPSLKLQ